MVEITHRLLHQASVPRDVPGFHQAEQAPHSYYYFRCLSRVPEELHLFRTEFFLFVSPFQGVKLSDVFEELTGILIVLYLCGVLELRPHMCHAADMVDVEHLVIHGNRPRSNRRPSLQPCSPGTKHSVCGTCPPPSRGTRSRRSSPRSPSPGSAPSGIL